MNFRLPGIAIDIDGVLLKGRAVVGNSPSVLRTLLEPYSESRVNIPFVLMTNGGGILEHDKAEDVNRKLGLGSQSEGDYLKLQSDHMILCHTPLKDS